MALATDAQNSVIRIEDWSGGETDASERDSRMRVMREEVVGVPVGWKERWERKAVLSARREAREVRTEEERKGGRPAAKSYRGRE